MSARASGSSAAFIHGWLAAATVCATPTRAAPTLSNAQPTRTQLFPTTDPILMILPFQQLCCGLKLSFFRAETIPTRN